MIKLPGNSNRTSSRGRVSIPGLLIALLLGALSSVACADGPRVEFSRQFVASEFGQIHVLASRPVSKAVLRTPLACFAPNPASGRYFKVFMQHLGQDRIMIAPDYPGLGDSAAPPDGMPDLAAYARAMAQTLTALGYGEAGKGKIDVCGYHTGAMVAVELAILRPDLVNKLLLMGIPYYQGEERQRMYRETVVHKPLSENFSDLEGSWDFAVTDREKGVELARGYDNFVDVLQAADRKSWAYHAVFSYPAEKRAPRVEQAVLILNTHGSLAQQTRDMATLFQQSELIEIPELHHGIFDVGADLLSAHARPFLDQTGN